MSAATEAESRDMLQLTPQFMGALTALMRRLAKMYKSCEVTQHHVAELLEHADEPLTQQRSVVMWHRAMESYYIDIVQTKDTARRDKAIRRALESNWFFSTMEMAAKWDDVSFDRSREKFVDAVRVLNAFAYLQQSFIGKLSGAVATIVERLGDNAGGITPDGVSTDVIMDIIPQLMDLMNPETMIELNRVLPHMVYVLGGRDKLSAMLDDALSGSSPVNNVLMQLISAMGTDESSSQEILNGSRESIRGILEKIADPDVDDALGEVVSEFGFGGELASVLDAESVRSMFAALQESGIDGEEGVGGMLQETISMISNFYETHADASVDDLSEVARSMLQERGISIDDDHIDSVRRIAESVMKVGAPGETRPIEVIKSLANMEWGVRNETAEE